MLRQRHTAERTEICYQMKDENKRGRALRLYLGKITTESAE